MSSDPKPTQADRGRGGSDAEPDVTPSAGDRSPGPDPVVGVGVFVVGLFVMAVGGAANWHYVFNAGEGVLLLGAVMFLASVAITAHRQSPRSFREIARAAMGVDAKPSDPD